MNSLVPMLLAIEPIRRPSTADLLASPTIAGWLQMHWVRQDDPERCQDRDRVLNDHMAGSTCHCTGVELIAREARLESKERALVEKRHELARRQDTIKSIEKALHARERMIQAREATLEAKVRR
ncbi:hypothetical protein NliqN6_5932 [Naganishia liquefaciens]|uniref:Uncharacterized protein n=1 Tax=Naganishia liquefaciens TaxID=104408 RepID=A0A8H3YH33_9TREE|nr:hypothetical protein NliqN6_5932 [Naganishia liquefaciens]